MPKTTSKREILGAILDPGTQRAPKMTPTNTQKQGRRGGIPYNCFHHFGATWAILGVILDPFCGTSAPFWAFWASWCRPFCDKGETDKYSKSVGFTSIIALGEPTLLPSGHPKGSFWIKNKVSWLFLQCFHGFPRFPDSLLINHDTCAWTPNNVFLRISVCSTA